MACVMWHTNEIISHMEDFTDIDNSENIGWCIVILKRCEGAKTNYESKMN